MTENKMLASVSIDTSEAQHQLSELMSLLELKFPSKLLPDLVFHELSTVSNDIILGDGPTTASAGFNIVHRARFGTKFERFASALRAGEFDFVL